LLAAGAAAFSGCTVDVLLGFTSCPVGGSEYAAGATFPDPEAPCRTGTCHPDGTVTWVENGCPIECEHEGVVFAQDTSQVFAGGCQRCTCLADQQVVCTEQACGPCAVEAPDCPLPFDPLCTVTPTCDDATGWACVEACPCDNAIPPLCAEPPTGCYWAGPYCDQDAWTCGELICDGCQSQPGLCPDPMMPGCWSEPWCDGFNWECIVVCDACAMNPMPPECVASQQDCMAFPYCDPIYGWQCYEECAMPGCIDMPPVCDTMDPQCYAQPVCLEGQWYCEIACVL
jgi:hypothetical protein